MDQQPKRSRIQAFSEQRSVLLWSWLVAVALKRMAGAVSCCSVARSRRTAADSYPKAFRALTISAKEYGRCTEGNSLSTVISSTGSKKWDVSNVAMEAAPHEKSNCCRTTPSSRMLFHETRWRFRSLSVSEARVIGGKSKNAWIRIQQGLYDLYINGQSTVSSCK